MKKGIEVFQLKVFAEENDGIFIDIGKSVKGVVYLKLRKKLSVITLMVGWSTTYHFQELLQSKTRIGKQFYIESIHSLVGEIESTKPQSLQSGDHFFEFEIPNQVHLFEANENVTTKSTTLLSWHNLKAAIVDEEGVVHYGDVMVYDGSNGSAGEIKSDAAYESSQLLSENIDVTGKVNACPVHRSVSLETINRKLDLHCKLSRPYFCPGEAVSFTVQCRNSSKKGYKQLFASLIERKANSQDKKQYTKSKATGSIIGPSVAPKEIVLWKSQLPSPSITTGDEGSWYTLQVELKNRFSTKLVFQVPVVIMQDPLTPTGVGM